jgi:hypothetical protein
MSVRLPVGMEEMMSGASNMSRDERLFDGRRRRGIARGDIQLITNIFEMDNASGRWESAIWKGKQRYASIISSQGDHPKVRKWFPHPRSVLYSASLSVRDKSSAC